MPKFQTFFDGKDTSTLSFALRNGSIINKNAHSSQPHLNRKEEYELVMQKNNEVIPPDFPSTSEDDDSEDDYEPFGKQVGGVKTVKRLNLLTAPRHDVN